MAFLTVANFKSNLTQSEVKAWLEQVKPQEGMVIAPSFPHLSLFPGFTLAAQDVSSFPKGSYTGAVNASQLQELGVKYALVGHSERRRYFHETTGDVANKVKELISVGITPLVCMDEADVTPQFAALDSEYLDKCIYCYEPSDGLGGSHTATPEQITKVRNQILNFAPNAELIYGGSVTADNISELLGLNLAGVLVATASLDPLSYNRILEVVHGA
jgi:triosephosphate isomerase (TIM)